MKIVRVFVAGGGVVINSISIEGCDNNQCRQCIESRLSNPMLSSREVFEVVHANCSIVKNDSKAALTCKIAHEEIFSLLKS